MCVAMGMVAWFECMDRPCIIFMASRTDAVVVTKLLLGDLEFSKTALRINSWQETGLLVSQP